MGEQSVFRWSAKAIPTIATNESVFFQNLSMPYFADSCKIMMFTLVLIKPHDTVIGLCGFLPAPTAFFLCMSSALQVIITVLAVMQMLMWLEDIWNWGGIIAMLLKNIRKQGLRSKMARIKCVWGQAVAQLVEALRYKSEGRGFDSRWCHWNFSLT